jgi:uncharacterized membrane protein
VAQLARIGAALAVLAAGAVHVYLYAEQDYRSLHVIGPLFLLNGIAAAAIGFALLMSANALVVLSGIVYAAATLVAFVVSATSGLFGWKETWSGTAQAVAGFTELGALVLLVALIVPRATPRTARVGEG